MAENEPDDCSDVLSLLQSSMEPTKAAEVGRRCEWGLRLPSALAPTPLIDRGAHPLVYGTFPQPAPAAFH